MIIKYSITNFLSIKLTETIDFRAHPLKREIKPLKYKILPVIALYGPNGGGKSSIIESMWYLFRFIKEPGFEQHFFYPSFDFIRNRTDSLSNHDNSISWSIELLSKTNKVFKYELSANQNFINYEKLSFYESINSKKEEIIFERKNTINSKNEISTTTNLIDELKNSNLNLDIVSPITTIIKFLSSLVKNELINDFVDEIKRVIFLNDDFMYDQIFNNDHFLTYFEGKRDLFLKIFNDLNLNISGFDIHDLNPIFPIPQLNPNFPLFPKKNKVINFHKKSLTGQFDLPFFNESKGTQKIIWLIINIIKNIDKNCVFISDELDSSLHTKLLQYILQIFHDQEINTCSQLIYSSHDMATLDAEYLREDEIYFVALNESNFTNVISLVEFDIRQSNNFAKKYLNGEIGYDPYIDKGLSWKDEFKKEK